MSFATMSAIAKVVHPDTRRQATEADLDRACKLFTAWKADKDKARRPFGSQARSPPPGSSGTLEPGG
jgi:hypothetical protein